MTVYDRDGNQVDRISIMRAFVDSGYIGLLFEANTIAQPYEACDPIHLNDARVFSAADAQFYEGVEPGDLLVSPRSLNAIAIIDPTTKRVKWVSVGKFVLQHSPRLLGDNQILLLDNMGGRANKGGSRLIKLDYRSGVVDTLFPRPTTPDDFEFFTFNAGHIGLHESRTRALVSLTQQGRIIEVDLETGDVLWEYVNTHEISLTFFGKARIRLARFSTHFAQYVENPSFEMNSGAR